MSSLSTLIPEQEDDFQLHWDEIEKSIPEEVEAMNNCMQDATYHAEGDVWTHTKMVCECLVEDKLWRELPDRERDICFMGTLLHDLGKPSKTVTDDEGFISSRGHAVKGARLARLLLIDLKVDVREEVCEMIRLHAIPAFNFMEGDPVKNVITASMTVNCQGLARLCIADFKGRKTLIESSQPEVLQAVEMFEGICRDNDCLNQTYPFPSDSTKYMYFHTNDIHPQSEYNDGTTFEVIMMSGLPGAGKDHYIKEHGLDALPMVSLDACRRKMGVKPSEGQSRVAAAAKEEALVYLRLRQPFVFNATNITRQIRSKWIDLFYRYHASTKIIYVEPEHQTLLAQNKNRINQVPLVVIEKLYAKLEVPTQIECKNLEIIS